MASPALKAPLGSGAYLSGSHSLPSRYVAPPLDLVVWSGASLLEVSRRCLSPSIDSFVDRAPPPDSLSTGVIVVDDDSSNDSLPGGPRGDVLFLSSAARRRLKADLGRVLLSSQFVFASLTMPGLPDHWSPVFFTFGPPRPLPGPRESKALLRAWARRCVRRWPSFSFHWKLEPQERGVPHFHLCIYGIDLTPENLAFMRDSWHEIAGRGQSAHVQRGFDAELVESGSTKARDYLAKYVSKDGALTLNPDVGSYAGSSPGRFWGVFNDKFIPYAKPKFLQVPAELSVVVLRILKRLNRAKFRESNRAQCERLLKREFAHVFGPDASFPDPVKVFHALKSSPDLQRKRAAGEVRFPRLFNPYSRVDYLRFNYSSNPERLLSQVFLAGSIWMRETKHMPRGNRPPPLAGPVGRLP